MPPRQPPSPAALTVLMIAATGASAWGAAQLDLYLQAVVGAALPGHQSLVVLCGTAGILLAAILLHGVTTLFRSTGWERGLGLAWLVVAVAWIPTALVSAVMPGSSGPMATLYAQLGDPQAGRWPAAGLGLAVWILLAAFLSGRALAVGRGWMRVDGLEFRRRLVRVVAGWPGVAAVLVLLYAAGWARTGWAAPWPLVVLLVLQLRTR